jgi:thymidylate synthase
MEKYLELLKSIKKHGVIKPPAREGMPSTQSLFGYQYRFNLQEGFPIHTTKKMNFKNIVTELLWFLRGDINIKYLIDNGCNIWNEDAYNYYKKNKQFKVDQFSFNQFLEWVGVDCKNGYVYGDCPLGYDLWRNFNGVDQITELIKGLKNNPESRRHLLSSYDPSMKDVALFPCHVMAQFNCRPLTIEQREEISSTYGFGYPSSKNKEEHFSYYNVPKYYLDCQLFQRSCDVFLGVPYNTASYSLLTHILAEITGMIAGDFIHSFGDVHIYENHKDAVETQLSRTPTKLPSLKINPTIINRDDINVLNLNELINGIEVNDFSLENYNPQSYIKGELSTGLKK